MSNEVMLGLIVAGIALGSIIGYITALKSQMKASIRRLFKLNFWELNKRYLYHFAMAKKYDEEIKRILSCVPTKSDGGVGNYQQAVDKAIKERKPHIVTRRIEPEEVKTWIEEDKKENKP